VCGRWTRNLQGQLDRYLELLSTTHSTGLRHLTLDALGQGQRELRVSYISEVPVWKSTYRIVFPREANGKATMQGWAVVDNTVGADWDNVQLSLVAGAPQSFIQPLSQPLYTRRPEIPIATWEQTTPQTHEAAEDKKADDRWGDAPAPQRLVSRQRRLEMAGRLAAQLKAECGSWCKRGRIPETAHSAADREMARWRSLAVGGGRRRLSRFRCDSGGRCLHQRLRRFLRVRAGAPVTIHKNESAMVPILQQDLPAEHVTLWSQKEPTPLRAVWLENTSKLTLDSGSFSIFESGEFAGEGCWTRFIRARSGC
jgi:hypothetical protein